jgi:HAD superfamily hydrolase (TIGR01490 family)
MQKFAVFDIDGTLIRWQLYHAVVDRLAKKGLLGEDAKERLREARMHWKKREHVESFRQYELTLIEVYEAALPNLDPRTFDQNVQEVIDEYKEQVYTYTRDLIVTLKGEGYMLLAISGSHHELVEKIAETYGFDAWQGSQYQRKSGKFTGEKFVASHDKRTVLQNMISEHKLTKEGSVAVGDSASDAPMLEMVDRPIAFNPDQNLFKIAQENHWPIVVERKNVIYQMEARDGSYILA